MTPERFIEILDSKGLRGLELDAPIQYASAPPDPAKYLLCLQQFGVEFRARYAQDDHTYCNILFADALRACLVPAPRHWVFGDDTPAGPYQTRKDSKGNTELAHELNANEVHDWMMKHGQQWGWKTATAAEAQKAADAGIVACFTWRNPLPNHSGHVGMVRPSQGRKGTWFAQAGATNSSDIEMSHVFINGAVPTFWVPTDWCAP